METEETIRTRRSVHQYSDEPLDDETLTELFDRTRRAPSSFNLQPWEFLVVRDDDNLAELQEIANGQEHVTDAAAVVVVLGNLDPAAHAAEVFTDWAEKGYLPNQEEADGLTQHVESWREQDESENRLWTAKSASLAAMTMMTAAWDMGIASCPMGGFDGDALTETYGTDGYEPVMLVALGYPAEDADDLEREQKSRRSVEEITHFESFEA
ncbi:NAD(P)H nitroreductase [Halobacteriales archaeon SW_6_65_46]|nr:MAG: NAD(P)H nitroreductase [Halobacteriales archaeon SW_6_65_46]